MDIDAGAIARAALLLADRRGHPVPKPCEDPLASLSQSLMGGPRPIRGLPLAGDDITGVIEHAWEWLGSIRIHPWIDPDPIPTQINGQSRIAIVGDWATGLYGAPVIGKTMASRKYDAIIHLGDIYYSGTPEEVGDRFVAYWPWGASDVHRSLNGNHDMYSGGDGYFGRLLPELRQPASCFALENDDWLILGLDTAYRTSIGELFLPPENDLYEGQLAWATGLVSARPGKRVILLTHHQPLSVLDRQGPKLLAKLTPILSTERVVAWYWGHEHRCCVYGRHPRFGFCGACVGHGGFPETRAAALSFPQIKDANFGSARWLLANPDPDRPSAWILDGYNRYVVGHEQEYAPNGFMILNLKGREMSHDFLSAEGDVLLAGGPI